MNKQQRTKLEEIKDQLEDMILNIRKEAESEQTKFDNCPEGLENSERFQAIEEIASDLDDIVSTLEQASSDLDNVLSK